MTEGDSVGASYGVRLATQPIGSVQIVIDSDAADEGSEGGLGSDYGITTELEAFSAEVLSFHNSVLLSFDNENWNIEQRVYVVASMGDGLVEGLESFNLSHTAANSTDIVYSQLSPGTVPVVVYDPAGLVFGGPASFQVLEGAD